MTCIYKVYDRNTFQSQVVAGYHEAASVMDVSTMEIMNGLFIPEGSTDWMFEAPNHILTVMVKQHAAP